MGVDGERAAVLRQGVGIGEVVDDFFDAHGVFGRQAAVVEKAAHVGVTAGIDVDAEGGNGLLGNGFDGVFRLLLVAFGVGAQGAGFGGDVAVSAAHHGGGHGFAAELAEHGYARAFAAGA